MQGLVDLLKQCEIIEAEDNGDDGPKKKQTTKQQEETQYEGLLSLPEISNPHKTEQETELESPMDARQQGSLESGHRAPIFC